MNVNLLQSMKTGTHQKAPVGMPGVKAENTSSVSPACRKRRQNGAPLCGLSG